MHQEPVHRRWLRRLTAGASTAGLIAVAVPATTAPEVRYGAPRPVERPATAQEAVAPLPRVELVGHRKPHPHRTIERYRVRPGDSPSAIAVRYHAWTAQLLRINHTTALYAGEVILVPIVTRAVAEHNQQIGKHRHGPGKAAGKAAGKAGKAAAGKAGKAGKAAAGKPGKGGKSGAGKPGKGGKAGAGKPGKAGGKGGAGKPGKAGGKGGKAAPDQRHRKPHAVRHARGWHHRGFTRAQVRRVIVRTAHRHGVNPDLALAVAWQEAGWQHGLVSRAGALGAMQVLPGTGQWMSMVVGRRLNLRDLHDNVTAGVVLLRELREQVGRRKTLAGYYQGLAGVRRHGMYPSTRRYVANVLALKKRIAAGWNPA